MPFVALPPKFHGQFPITSGVNDRFRVLPQGGSPAFNVVLAAGTGTTSGYFIRAHTNGPEGIPSGRTGGSPGAATGVGAQLVEEIQGRIQAQGGNFAGATCTVSDTGIVTIANAAETFQIGAHSDGGTNEWTDGAGGAPGLGIILGYTDILTTTSNTFVAPHQHRYGWYPDTSPADFDGSLDSPDVGQSDTKIERAPTGLVTTRNYSSIVYDRVYQFLRLSKAYMWIQDEDTVDEFSGVATNNRSLERFWLDVLRVGAQVRYYRDRDVQTAPGGGNPWAYVAASEIARRGPGVGRTSVPHWDNHWDVEIDLHRFVS